MMKLIFNFAKLVVTLGLLYGAVIALLLMGTLYFNA